MTFSSQKYLNFELLEVSPMHYVITTFIKTVRVLLKLLTLLTFLSNVSQIIAFTRVFTPNIFLSVIV